MTATKAHQAKAQALEGDALDREAERHAGEVAKIRQPPAQASSDAALEALDEALETMRECEANLKAARWLVEAQRARLQRELASS